MGDLVMRAHRLSRRRFLRHLGGAGAGLAPLLLVAGCDRWSFQSQRVKPLTIGYFGLGYPRNLQLVDIFFSQVKELVAGQRGDITMEQRVAEPDGPLLDLAAELVSLKVDLIFAVGTPYLQAVKQATTTIPIIAISPDPVGSGVVGSLAHPDGNITGISMLFSTGLDTKRVELLKDTLPGARRAGIFWNPSLTDKRQNFLATQEAMVRLGLQPQALEVRGPNDFDGAFSTATRERVDAIVTLIDSLTNGNWPKVAEFAMEQHLPSICEGRGFPAVGGLMSYGQDYAYEFRRAASYVDKIVNGAKPADLPIEQPTKFDFVINLKTAQALGLTIPQSVLLQATELMQ